MNETFYTPQDHAFVNALSYASVRREYVDFYLKADSKKLRAFVERVLVSADETRVELTSGQSLRTEEIDRVSVYFDELGGTESISCLCQ
jgi:hypothetical protein